VADGAATTGRVVVQTSSWADPEFSGTWYPKDLPAKERLRWHAQWFEGVEVNTSFYAVPLPQVTEGWVEQTPEGFSFDVKLHRLLSFHRTQLDALPPSLRAAAHATPRGAVMRSAPLVAAMCEEIRASLQPLVESRRLASLLLQLAPSFGPATHQLDELVPIIDALAPLQVAVEFRHRGWVIGDQLARTEAWLEAQGCAFVCTDGPVSDDDRTPPAVDAVTTPRLSYLRLHGRNLEGYLRGTTVAERFDHRYSEPELAEVAARVRGLAEQAGQVRVSFNNNHGDLAPRAAARLRVLLGQTVDEPPGEQLELGL
jgi:uncharacterized protein YecE (DUF72 family)